MSVIIDLPPHKPATINEVAAIEFEALPADTPVPGNFEDIEFALRLAHAIMINSKNEVVATVRRAESDGVEMMLDHLDAAEDRLKALAKLAWLARTRLLIGVGVVAQG